MRLESERESNWQAENAPAKINNKYKQIQREMLTGEFEMNPNKKKESFMDEFVE